MYSMTLEQLCASANAGGITGVTLKGEGAGFFMEIQTRSGQDAILAKARSNEPRHFGNPTSALKVLRKLGIAVVKLDASHWDPRQKNLNQSRDQRAQAMREAHKAVAYNEWLASEIQEAIGDSRPNFSHEAVLTGMHADIAALEARDQRGKANGLQMAD